MKPQIVDAGHVYVLPVFDGQVLLGSPLTFMKREGEGFPGNTGHFPGTSLQAVLRACLDRVRYLQRQIPCDNNVAIICHIGHAILELERRAAERHGFNPKSITLEMATEGEMCPDCGHVKCHHEQLTSVPLNEDANDSTRGDAGLEPKP